MGRPAVQSELRYRGKFLRSQYVHSYTLEKDSAPPRDMGRRRLFKTLAAANYIKTLINRERGASSFVSLVQAALLFAEIVAAVLMMVVMKEMMVVMTLVVVMVMMVG